MKHEPGLSDISERIAEILGLNFQANQWNDMEGRLIAAAKDLKIDYSISGLNEWLSQTQFTNIEINALSAHLTIGESYFFRERPGLDLFIQRIIPELINQRRGKNEQIRIWSAGCSSGEEPYTLAILIKEHFPELNDWNVKISATDISPIAIQKALQGEYTDWSFRDTETTIKSKYFAPLGKNWRIMPEIKKMISFSYLNLSKNSFPSRLTDTEEIDVIFCRNVMMYFTPQVIMDVSARFKNSLCENGWLITSQVELNDEYFSNFARVNYSSGIFYQKTNKSDVPVKRPIDNAAHSAPVVLKKREEKKVEIPKTVERMEKRVPANKPHEKITQAQTDPDSLFQKGHYQHCIDSCLQIISLGKLNNKIFSLLVKSYANSGLFSVGEKIIVKMLDSNTATPEMYYIYASLLSEQNDLRQAEVALKKALYLDHKHILSHLMLGNVFLKNEKKHLAIKHFETIIRLLNKYHEHEIVPESEGLTAGIIKELTSQILNKL